MNSIPNIAALVGCAFLLVFWLTVGKRKLIGFYFTCTGWAAIVACVRSDHSLTQMLGILIATTVVASLGLVGYATFKAHRLARRRQVVYRPGAALRRIK